MAGVHLTLRECLLVIQSPPNTCYWTALRKVKKGRSQLTIPEKSFLMSWPKDCGFCAEIGFEAELLFFFKENEVCHVESA